MTQRTPTGATSWLAFLMALVLIGVSALSVDAYMRTHRPQQLAELDVSVRP